MRGSPLRYGGGCGSIPTTDGTRAKSRLVLPHCCRRGSDYPCHFPCFVSSTFSRISVVR